MHAIFIRIGFQTRLPAYFKLLIQFAMASPHVAHSLAEAISIFRKCGFVLLRSQISEHGTVGLQNALLGALDSFKFSERACRENDINTDVQFVGSRRYCINSAQHINEPAWREAVEEVFKADGICHQLLLDLWDGFYKLDVVGGMWLKQATWRSSRSTRILRRLNLNARQFAFLLR